MLTGVMNVKMSAFCQYNINNNNNKRLFGHQSPRGEGHFTIPTIPFVLLSVFDLSARYSSYSWKQSSSCSWVVSPFMKKRETKKKTEEKTIAFCPPAFHIQIWGNLVQCLLLWWLWKSIRFWRHNNKNNNENSNKRLFWHQSPMEKGHFTIPTIPFLLLSVYNLSAFDGTTTKTTTITATKVFCNASLPWRKAILQYLQYLFSFCLFSI